MAQEQDKERAQPLAWQWINRETGRSGILPEVLDMPNDVAAQYDWIPLYAAPQPNAALADGWADISTAPKDGTPVLLYTACGLVEACWSSGEWENQPIYCTYSGCGGPAFTAQPTHWRPLPAPPTLNATDEVSP